MVTYAKGGKDLLVGRITLDQFRTRNKPFQVSSEMKRMITSGELSPPNIGGEWVTSPVEKVVILGGRMGSIPGNDVET